MKNIIKKVGFGINRFFTKLGFNLRGKLITLFLIIKIVPLLILIFIVFNQFAILRTVVDNRTDLLGEMVNQTLEETGKIAIQDSKNSLSDLAVESIEQTTTDMANSVSKMLYDRDADIQTLANVIDFSLSKNQLNSIFEKYIESKTSQLIKQSIWLLVDANGHSIYPVNMQGNGLKANGELLSNSELYDLAKDIPGTYWTSLVEMDNILPKVKDSVWWIVNTYNEEVDGRLVEKEDYIVNTGIVRTNGYFSINEDHHFVIENQVTQIKSKLSAPYVKDGTWWIWNRDTHIVYIVGILPFVGPDGNWWVGSTNSNIPAGGSSTNPIDPSKGTDENLDDGNKNGVNDDWSYRNPDAFDYETRPLYDQIAYFELDGTVKAAYSTNNTTKIEPLTVPENFSNKSDTYLGSEDFWEVITNSEYKLDDPSDIYVSDVIGEYRPSRYLGMYTPANIKTRNSENLYQNLSAIAQVICAKVGVTIEKKAATQTHQVYYSYLKNELNKATPSIKLESDHEIDVYNVAKDLGVTSLGVPTLDFTKLPHPGIVDLEGNFTANGWEANQIEFDPENESFANQENPFGKKYDGIVRWIVPVFDGGTKTGYLTLALNQAHISELVSHMHPSGKRYVELNSAFDGNYGFIWDYKCRNVVHPRHNSIYGFDAVNGIPQIPWLFTDIYNNWKVTQLANSGLSWYDYVMGNYDSGTVVTTFDHQVRSKAPTQVLTDSGLVGLDGRYLNNAPQCTGWMDMSRDGGSGSFYILWSGVYKITTVAAIRYYSGQYSQSVQGNARGFGVVTVGAGIDEFLEPITQSEKTLGGLIGASNEDIKDSSEITKGNIQSRVNSTTKTILITAAIIILLIILIAIWVANSITGNIYNLEVGISKFRDGDRSYRFKSVVKDEFGRIKDSFDDMADSIENSMKLPQVIVDKGNRIIYMNSLGLIKYKVSLENVVGTNYSELSAFEANSIYDPILALKEKREANILHITENDTYLKGVANYFYNRNGEMAGYIIESQDMTSVVKDQRRIETERTLLDKVVMSSPDLIYYIDADGKFLTVNPRFSSIVNLKPEDFVGKHYSEVFDNEYGEKFKKAFESVQSSKLPIYQEEKINFYDGHTEVLDAVRTPIFNTENKFIGVLGFSRDVSNRVNIESALRDTQKNLEAAVEEARDASAHKGDFLARMSHEIRTPMNAIIGITNIVKSELKEKAGELNDKFSDIFMHLGQIETSSQHLLGLLNDILDLSKIEAGKIELVNEDADLEKLFNTVCNIISPRCSDKNITFNTEFTGFVNSHYMTDSLRLRQVLINLLGNAVKFTPELGTVDFKIICEKDDEKQSTIRFRVQDSGIGIAKDDLPKVFTAFEQANQTISKRFGGTGLGLAISQRIVNLFHSEITLESVVDYGSTFEFVIELQKISEEKIEVIEVSDATGKFAGKRALLVDDIDINRMIVMSLLEPTGIQIEEAADGQEAIEKVQESALNHYDIIFMDIRMPNVNGYDATKAIRKLERTDAKIIPIIALTANAFKDDIDAAVNSGMNGHLAKPIEYDMLIETLFKYLGKK